MADVLTDLEEQRLLDRIRCITYREIQDEIIVRNGRFIYHSPMHFRKTIS